MAKGWSFNSQGWSNAKQRWDNFFSKPARRVVAKLKNDAKVEVQRITKGGNLDIRDAQSWNKETHPEGPGPSKLVKDIKYENDGDMTVTYRDNFTARYKRDYIDEQQAKSFAKADSKGRWALKNLWPLPYEEV